MIDQHEIDWSLTTWEGSRGAQLRQALAMTLRERMEAMEALAEVARTISGMRAQSGDTRNILLPEANERQAANEPSS